MVRIYDKDTNAYVGEITEEDLQFLIDKLEEESSEDTDYYIDQDVIDVLSASGASDELLALLQRAIGKGGETEIYWSKEEDV